MASLIALVVLFILSKSNSKVLAYPSDPYISTNRICASLTIPVTVDHARNTIYRVLPVNNDADAVEYSLDLDNASAPVRNISQFNIVNETFDISVQLCTPKVTVGDKAKALQIATHGLYFDKRYWDSTLSPSTYSYVASALDAGYTILTYDRLGTGLSTKPNAYTHLQVSLELEILRGLSTLALSGSLLTHAKFCDTPQDVASTLRSLKYTKLVHVGHSFGSILTTALAAIYPSITSTIVLTGWIPNNHARDFGISSFGLVYAGQPGYVKQGNQSYVEAAFFHEPFSLAALRYATKIRAPVGVVETVSVTPFVSISGSGFTGSVLYVLAEFDALICGGDCNPLYLGINGLMSYLWQTAGRREHYLVKGAGHGLALHPSAPQGYEVIRAFLEG